MIGGRPGLAYYFVGHIESSLIYLDPHFVQVSFNNFQIFYNFKIGICSF